VSDNKNYATKRGVWTVNLAVSLGDRALIICRIRLGGRGEGCSGIAVSVWRASRGGLARIVIKILEKRVKAHDSY